jgi:hypothetical protein
MVNGTTTAMLTVNAYVQIGAENVPFGAHRSPRLPAGLIAVLTLIFALLILPGARWMPSRWRWAFGCGALALVFLLNGCGGGSSAPPPPTIQKIPAPPGTYGVLVSASASGTAHNAKIMVVVQ